MSCGISSKFFSPLKTQQHPKFVVHQLHQKLFRIYRNKPSIDSSSHVASILHSLIPYFLSRKVRNAQCFHCWTMSMYRLYLCFVHCTTILFLAISSNDLEHFCFKFCFRMEFSRFYYCFNGIAVFICLFWMSCLAMHVSFFIIETMFLHTQKNTTHTQIGSSFEIYFNKME